MNRRELLIKYIAMKRENRGKNDVFIGNRSLKLLSEGLALDAIALDLHGLVLEEPTMSDSSLLGEYLDGVSKDINSKVSALEIEFNVDEDISFRLGYLEVFTDIMKELHPTVKGE